MAVAQILNMTTGKVDNNSLSKTLEPDTLSFSKKINITGGEDDGVSIGFDTNNPGDKAITIGSKAVGGEDGVAIGFESNAGSHGVGVGATANAGGDNAVAVGNGSHAGNGSVGIGATASGAGDNSVAIGNASSAPDANCVALGNGATTGVANQIVIQSGANPIPASVESGCFVNPVRDIDSADATPDNNVLNVSYNSTTNELIYNSKQEVVPLSNSSGSINFANLPTTDPQVVGQLFIDTADNKIVVSTGA